MSGDSHRSEERRDELQGATSHELTAWALVRERRDALERAGCSPTQAYVMALEERLLDEYRENQRLWNQQPDATV